MMDQTPDINEKASYSGSGTANAPPITDEAAIQLHPLPLGDGVIVKILPPREPLDTRLTHMPCDIVLVIDISGSMGIGAPVPGGSEPNYGFSVLDLTKHAALTILETLDKTDRLAIITFSVEAKVLQALTPMTRANKVKARENILSMQPYSSTNLWAGINEGLKLFASEVNTGRVPAVMVSP
jgi:hypothetical protein